MALGYTGDVFVSFIALHSQSSIDFPCTTNISLTTKDTTKDKLTSPCKRMNDVFFPSCAMSSSLSH